MGVLDPRRDQSPGDAPPHPPQSLIVLDLYEEVYDPQYPTVCLDEKPVVLHADVQPPMRVEPGLPERVDYEYERRGTRNLFVLVEP